MRSGVTAVVNFCPSLSRLTVRCAWVRTVSPTPPCREVRSPRVGNGRKVEGGQGLARIEMRLGPMALDAPLASFGELVFERRGEEACGLSAFFIGALGETRATGVRS